MGPGDLSSVLAPLARKSDPRILIGHETFDDAGVFRVSDDVAIVQTVDFFAPIVDDPYEFGQVAAANALSDIYAMGGTPLTALNIAAFPTEKLPLEILTEILRGGQDKVHEAGAHVIGGHTVIDDEIKYGLSVTGRIDPASMLTNANARRRSTVLMKLTVSHSWRPRPVSKRSTPTRGGGCRPMRPGATRVARPHAAPDATDVTASFAGHLSHIVGRVTSRTAADRFRLILPRDRCIALGQAWGRIPQPRLMQ
jgi:selenide,water dikinase